MGRCFESVGGEDPFLAKIYAKIIVDEYQKKMNDNQNQKQVELLSEKYGYENNIEYNKTKENKLLGLVIIVVVLVILIVLAILINVIRNG